jgi:hypothetical protein
MKTVAFFLCLFSIGFLHAQKINLQLNLKAGETYSQLQTSKVSVHQNLNGQNVETEVTMTAKTAYHINTITDSVYSLDLSFESLSFQMKSAQGSIESSSENGENSGVMGRALKALVHHPIFARMTRHGKFLEVQSNSIINKVVDEFTEIDEAQKKQIKQQLEQAWGEEAFKSSFEMFSAFYPNKNVQVGDQWPIQTQLKSAVLLNLDALYTFVNTSDEGYAVHGDIQLSPSAKDVATIVNGMSIVYDLSGTMTSDIVLNKQTSWISKASISQTISGTASVKDSEQVPGGLTIPMTMKSQTTLSEK